MHYFPTDTEVVTKAALAIARFLQRSEARPEGARQRTPAMNLTGVGTWSVEVGPAARAVVDHHRLVAMAGRRAASWIRLMSRVERLKSSRGCSMLTVLAFAVGLTVSQAGNQPFAATWMAEFEGKTFVHVELTVINDALGGSIGLGDIEVNADGDVRMAASAPAKRSAIFDVVLRDSTLSFSRKDGADTDRFEMRLVSEQAELRFLLSDEDRSELAAAGVPVPKPIRLKKVVR
jgi:hypothetical protein